MKERLKGDLNAMVEKIYDIILCKENLLITGSSSRNKQLLLKEIYNSSCHLNREKIIVRSSFSLPSLFEEHHNKSFFIADESEKIFKNPVLFQSFLKILKDSQKHGNNFFIAVEKDWLTELQWSKLTKSPVIDYNPLTPIYARPYNRFHKSIVKDSQLDFSKYSQREIEDSFSLDDIVYLSNYYCFSIF